MLALSLSRFSQVVTIPELGVDGWRLSARAWLFTQIYGGYQPCKINKTLSQVLREAREAFPRHPSLRIDPRTK